jgi:hypothetical protein
VQSRAEEIFRQYDGSRFYMSREGDLDVYLSLGATPEHERVWRQEMITETIRDARTGDTRSLTSLLTLEAVEALPELAELVSERDGFYRVRCAETVWRLADLPSAADDEVWTAVRAAEGSCREIAAGKFSDPGAVSEMMLELDGAPDARAYVIGRARNSLRDHARSPFG